MFLFALAQTEIHRATASLARSAMPRARVIR
jgi:hypothetical protein